MDNTLLEAQRAAERWAESERPSHTNEYRQQVIMLALLSIAESLADIARNSAVKREESRERIRNL